MSTVKNPNSIRKTHSRASELARNTGGEDHRNPIVLFLTHNTHPYAF